MPFAGTPWTSTMDAHIRHIAAIGGTAAQAAPGVGKSRNAVISRARKLQVRFSNGPAAWSPEEDRRLLDLWAKEWTAEEIGEELGKTKAAVWRHLRVLRERMTKRTSNQHTPSGKLKTAVAKRVVTQEERQELVAAIGRGHDMLMENLEKNSCRYPVSDTAPFTFCGRPREHGSYCEDHWRVTRAVAPVRAA